MKKLLLSIIMIFVSGQFLFAGEKNAGFGCLIGSPLGLTGRIEIFNPHLIAFGIGDAEGEGFYLYTDYLHVFYRFPKVQSLSLLAGGGLAFHKYKKENKNDSNIDENRFEVRLPIAVEYIFEKVPVGISIHFDPCLRFTQDVDFNLRGGVGAQFYF